MIETGIVEFEVIHSLLKKKYTKLMTSLTFSEKHLAGLFGTCRMLLQDFGLVNGRFYEFEVGNAEKMSEVDGEALWQF